MDTPAPAVLTGTDYDQERAKWEQPQRTFREYPKMLYQARLVDTKVVLREWTVDDAEAERAAQRDGWLTDPKEATAKYHAQQDDIASAAAEAAFNVRRMSAAAQREYREEEQRSEDHVTDVPVPASRKGKR